MLQFPCWLVVGLPTTKTDFFVWGIEYECDKTLLCSLNRLVKKQREECKGMINQYKEPICLLWIAFLQNNSFCQSILRWHSNWKVNVFKDVVYDSKVFNSKVFDSKVFDSKVFDSKVFDSWFFDYKVFNSKVFNFKIFNSEVFKLKIFDSSDFHRWVSIFKIQSIKFRV